MSGTEDDRADGAELPAHNAQCHCFSPVHHPGREMTAENVAAYERQRLEHTEAYGLLSPDAKARLEELRGPEVSALKAVIDRAVTDSFAAEFGTALADGTARTMEDRISRLAADVSRRLGVLPPTAP